MMSRIDDMIILETEWLVLCKITLDDILHLAERTI